MESANIDSNGVLETAQGLTQGLPAEWQLAGLWPYVVLLVASVLIGLHGERLTRVLILGIFIAIGAAIGQRVADWLTLPLWPTVIFVGSLGGLFAYMLYRWALGLALAVAIAGAFGAWSVGTQLQKEDISQIFSDVAAVQPQVEETASPSRAAVAPVEGAPDAANPFGDPLVLARYGELLDNLYQRGLHLRDAVAQKPEAQKHFLIMLLAGAGVGLLAGLVLGRLAAILWTSVLGAAGAVVGLAKLAMWLRPEYGTWLSDNRQYVLAAGVVFALLFIARQGARRPSLTAAPVTEVASPSDKS